MRAEELKSCPGDPAEITRDLLAQYQQEIYRSTDRLFAWLLVLQWFGGLIAAIWVSPLTWSGNAAKMHPHVWAALSRRGHQQPAAGARHLATGRTLTRHAIAIGQALSSSLLIHLMGGRIETHFHVFGSLAFLAIYRDLRCADHGLGRFIAADHLVRGPFWPQSIYGVLNATWLRSLEHAGWVVFEDIFLILSCRRSQAEMLKICQRKTELMVVNRTIEQEVEQRTAESMDLRDQLTRQAADLRQAVEAAQAANVAKSEFPGQHEPRDSHPHDRHPGLCGSDALAGA